MDATVGKFRRQVLCKLAGWDEARFKSARHDLQAKKKELYGSVVDSIERCRTEEESVSERAGTGWGTFSFADVLALMAMDDFARREGISLSRAYRIFWNNVAVLYENWAAIVEGKSDIFIGFVWLGATDNEDGGGFHVGGKLHDIASQIERGERIEKGRFAPYEDVSRVAMVNVTFTFRRLMQNLDAFKAAEVAANKPAEPLMLAFVEFAKPSMPQSWDRGF